MQAKNETNVTFVQSLEKLMEARDLNAHQLAKAMSIPHVTIGNYLDGRIPHAEILIKLADFFGVSTDELLGRAKARPEPYGRLRDVPRQHEVDEMIAAVENLRESFHAVERAAKRLRADKPNSTPAGDVASAVKTLRGYETREKKPQP